MTKLALYIHANQSLEEYSLVMVDVQVLHIGSSIERTKDSNSGSGSGSGSGEQGDFTSAAIPIGVVR